jgi:competence protein CoiA
MQLFAYDSFGQLYSASSAKRGVNYHCWECQGVVRLRLGNHRRPHFFHLRPLYSCRQSGKSLIHLQTQCYLSSLFPAGECAVEKRFPAIGRIADAVCEKYQLIFEIQCSPIAVEEVKKRNSDYASQGYQVVWILHDQRFNQKHCNAVETYLRDHPHYYTNLNAEGQGIIYDQFALFHYRMKKHGLPPLRVDLSQPLYSKISPSTLSLIEKRRKSWPLYFSGDLLDLHQQGLSDYLQQALTLESLWQPSSPSLAQHILSLIRKTVVRPYRLLLQMLLERACR